MRDFLKFVGYVLAMAVVGSAIAAVLIWALDQRYVVR